MAVLALVFFNKGNPKPTDTPVAAKRESCPRNNWWRGANPPWPWSGARRRGHGLFVRPGILVTNSHVIAEELMGQVKVLFPSAATGGKEALASELLYEDRQRDLAILRVATSLRPLRLANQFTLRGGEKALVIGNPGITAGEHVTLENAVTQGLMSTETTLNGLKFYQLSATVNPGNSGGPVFDARGHVVGVVTRKAIGARQEGMGFAIPLSDVHAALRSGRPVEAAGRGGGLPAQHGGPVSAPGCGRPAARGRNAHLCGEPGHGSPTGPHRPARL